MTMTIAVGNLRNPLTIETVLAGGVFGLTKRLRLGPFVGVWLKNFVATWRL